MADLGIVTYAAITAICYLVGLGVSVSKADSRYIPIIMGACGAGLGVACFFGIDGFADTVIDAIAIGIVSGFAATGIDQVYKQLHGTSEEESEE